jgi:hypothetical protein
MFSYISSLRGASLNTGTLTSGFQSHSLTYVGVLISLWLFLFGAQPKDFFLVGLKKLEQGPRKCMWSSGENMQRKLFFSNHVACYFFIKPKTYQPLLV